MPSAQFAINIEPPPVYALKAADLMMALAFALVPAVGDEFNCGVQMVR